MDDKYKAQKKSVADFVKWSEETGIEVENIDILRHSVAFEEGGNACEKYIKTKLEKVTVFKYIDQ